MKNNQVQGEYTHRNVMEILVAEEIDRQILRLPNNIKKFINPIEVATYALNRLPTLYASSQQGYNKQKLKGRSEHSVKITQEVRKGIAAIQQDVLRISTPLVVENERDLDRDLQAAREALEELAEYIPEQDLTWKNVVKLIKPILAELKEEDWIKIKTKNIRSKSSDLWDGSVYKK